MSSQIRAFVRFLMAKAFQGESYEIKPVWIDRALAATLADARYSVRERGDENIIAEIVANGNSLPVFFYRLGREIREAEGADSPTLPVVHGLMREVCSCEIYFSNVIGVGLQVIHGLGTVIGSRNTIGRGFRIYQGSTVGHRTVGEGGATIGNDVILYANASILGPITIGDGVIVRAQTIVTADVDSPEKSSS
ncbi:MAG: hypothetical protein ABJF10_26090 [Chthoniobacter sp.]|uniref:hypothetical protein n=1 Tax=Chthoniobacter sp. TaxID=2510640 RepID=UPI0032AC8DCD